MVGRVICSRTTVALIAIACILSNAEAGKFNKRTRLGLAACTVALLGIGSLVAWKYQSEKHSLAQAWQSGLRDVLANMVYIEADFLRDGFFEEPIGEPSSISPDDLTELLGSTLHDLLIRQDYGAYRFRALPDVQVDRDLFLRATQNVQDYVRDTDERYIDRFLLEYDAIVVSPFLPQGLEGVYEGKLHFRYTAGHGPIGLTVRVLLVTVGVAPGLYYVIEDFDTDDMALE